MHSGVGVHCQSRHAACSVHTQHKVPITHVKREEKHIQLVWFLSKCHELDTISRKLSLICSIQFLVHYYQRLSKNVQPNTNVSLRHKRIDNNIRESLMSEEDVAQPRRANVKWNGFNIHSVGELINKPKFKNKQSKHAHIQRACITKSLLPSYPL